MIKLTFLIIFSILSLTFASYGQACGTGTFRIAIVQNDSIKFELFSITPKGMNWYSKEAKDYVAKNLSFFYEGMKTLDYSVIRIKNINQKAEKFLKKYDVDNFEAIVTTNPSAVKIEGKSYEGVISFQTHETLSEPLILKLSSKKYGKFYLYGAFLGGCNTNVILDLNKNTKTVTHN